MKLYQYVVYDKDGYVTFGPNGQSLSTKSLNKAALFNTRDDAEWQRTIDTTKGKIRKLTFVLQEIKKKKVAK